MLSDLLSKVFSIALATAALTVAIFPQSKPGPKTLYFDSDGNAITNNEFVDIRLANPHYPDATVVKALPDGSTEFHLQRVPQEGMTAPAFTVRTVDGRMISLTDLRGKVVVLSFWFIGCPSCRAIKPKLNEFKTKFAGRDDVIFIAMTADPKNDVGKYLDKEPFDYLQVADAGTTMSKFAFKGYPRNIVIDKQGKMVYWRSSIYAWDKFEAVVRSELLKN